MNCPLVLAWCDDLFLQGHQFARWIVDYVDLEESLAMGTLAQDLLAHAGALLGICGFDAGGRDAHIYERQADRWFPSSVTFLPEGNWPATVARGLVLSLGAVVLRRHLRLPDRPSTERLAAIIAAEQDLHMQHWERWAAILGTHEGLAPQFRLSLQEALTDAGDLFSLPEAASTDEMLATEPARLHREWLSRTGDVLAQIGLQGLELPEAPAAWRQAAGNCEPMNRIITDLRHTRGPNGARQYEVYR